MACSGEGGIKDPPPWRMFDVIGQDDRMWGDLRETRARGWLIIAQVVLY
jgi:hypothetical protein